MHTPSWHDVAAAVTSPTDLAADFSNINDVRGNHTFRAKDVAELHGVLGAIAFNLNSFNVSTGIGQNIDGIVEHEAQHAYASHRVGATGRRFEVDIFRNPQGALEFVATHRFNEGLSRLATAAILLYPSVPSKFDLHDAGRMGYDLKRVADEAQRMSDTDGTYIPVPLSYKPKDAAIIDLGSRIRRTR